METKRRGRPPLAAEDKREMRYAVRLTAAEYELVDRYLAGEAGTYAARALVREARRRERAAQVVPKRGE